MRVVDSRPPIRERVETEAKWDRRGGDRINSFLALFSLLFKAMQVEEEKKKAKIAAEAPRKSKGKSRNKRR